MTLIHKQAVRNVLLFITINRLLKLLNTFKRPKQKNKNRLPPKACQVLRFYPHHKMKRSAIYLGQLQYCLYLYEELLMESRQRTRRVQFFSCNIFL